jgi:hypothetical protein
MMGIDLPLTQPVRSDRRGHEPHHGDNCTNAWCPTRLLLLGAAMSMALLSGPTKAQQAFIGLGHDKPTDGGLQIGKYCCLVWSHKKDEHPQRFPHGPHGDAWVSVAADDAGREWKRLTLFCDRVLKERQRAPEDGYLKFSDLPGGVACEIRFRGGSPPLTVHLRTPVREGEAWGWVGDKPKTPDPRTMVSLPNAHSPPG